MIKMCFHINSLWTVLWVAFLLMFLSEEIDISKSKTVGSVGQMKQSTYGMLSTIFTIADREYATVGLGDKWGKEIRN